MHFIYNKKRLLAFCFWSLFGFLASLQSLMAQGYIAASTLVGGTDDEVVTTATSNYISVVGGETYIATSSRSTDFPTTDGSIHYGQMDMGITKLDANGNIVFSTLIGGSDLDDVKYIKVQGGVIYVLGVSYSSNFPVTNGSSLTTPNTNDFVVCKLDASTGALLFSTYFGGTNFETFIDAEIDNSNIYLLGSATTPNYPVIGGGEPYHGFDSEIVYTKFDLSGTPVFSTCIGGTGYENTDDAAISVDNGDVYISYVSYSTDIAVTNGSTFPFYSFLLSSSVLIKYDNNNNIDYHTYLVGALYAEVKAKGGNAYVVGYTEDFIPVTDASHNRGGRDLYAMKIDGSGNTVFCTLVGGINDDYFVRNSLNVENDQMYFLASSSSPDYPITNGTTPGIANAAALTKLNTDGTIGFASFFGAEVSGSVTPVELVVESSGDMYLLSLAARAASVQTTDGSASSTNQELPWFIHLNSDGNVCYSTVIEGVDALSTRAFIYDLLIENNNAYFVGAAVEKGYPTTTNVSFHGNPSVGRDIYVTHLDLNPTLIPGTDNISPASQNVCAYGLATTLNGASMAVPPTGFPALYREGSSSAQHPIEAKYQWQSSLSTLGPWTDIPGAVLEDYLPSIGATDEYYRRITKLSNCASSPYSTSSVAAAIQNGLAAPTVDAGGVFHTCPANAVTIGGVPTATGGTGSYTYSWDNGGGASANPSVTPSATTIYTVYVTDNGNGCQQIGQALVNAWQANAGVDRSVCAGAPVRLLGQAISGLSGVSYSWTPASGLDNPSLAQPMASPGATTTYTLSLTIPITGGGTCSNTDNVDVQVVSPPSANFAGLDVTFCYPGPVTIGLAPEAGYTYTWAPGAKLDFNMASQATYMPGPVFYPNPDSAVYYLTATRAGCSFVDAVTINIINADAGPDGCGPRIIGGISDVPLLAETFSWTKVSGLGNFIGGTNTPTTTVTSSGAGTTIYELTTTYKGVTCTDQVSVPPCICTLGVVTTAPFGCPNTAFGPFTMTATPAVGIGSDYTYTWSPATGLSSTTGQTVSVTDNLPHTYTVTATSSIDPTFSCSATIDVNQTNMTLPVFTAKDTFLCPGQSANIGMASVAGYDYLWTPNTNLSPNNTVSNPAASPTINTSYVVIVTDVGTGCFTKDTATIVVRNVYAKAGPDWTVCDNAIIKLGTQSAQPHCLYAWEPGTAPWQNATDSTFAQPDVLIATSLEFRLMVTDTLTGCIARDTVQVTVDNTPTLSSAPDLTLCKGTRDTLGLPALPGVIYAWTPTTGLSCSNCAQPILTATSTTTYTVDALFPNCGTPVQDVVLVTVNSTPSNMADINYCPSSGPVTLGTDAPVGMTSYSWSGLVTSANTQITTTLTPPPSASTDFELTFVDGNNCTLKDTVTITPNVSMPIAGADVTMCLGTSKVLGSASNTGLGTYTWSPATGLSCVNCVQPTFTPLAAGNYTFTLSYTDLGCTNTDEVEVTVIDFTLPTISSPTICQGSCTSIGTTPVFGVQYFWSPSSGLSNDKISMPTTCVNATTSYTLTAINPQGCVATQNVIVGVSPIPAPTITASDVNLCFGTPSTTLAPSVSPVGTYSYLWSPDNGTLNDVYSATPIANIVGTGTYTYNVVVTNTANYCASTASMNVNVSFCPFPIELLSFDAEKVGNKSLLYWVTERETNASHFEVERQTSADWETIGIVNSLGNTMNPVEYTFWDENPLIGWNTYRLRMIDLDGSHSYSNLVSLLFVKDKNTTVNIYPNPTDAKVNISIEDIDNITNMALYNSLGQIQSVSFNPESDGFSLNTVGLPEGIYIVSIARNKSIENYKLIVTH